MQYDFKKTLDLIKDGLFDHQNTWKTYLEDTPGWQQTALVLIADVDLDRHVVLRAQIWHTRTKR